jgi:hypothetical protein
MTVRLCLAALHAPTTEGSESHDESALINTPAPAPEELATDLELLRTWSKRVDGRRNFSEEKIYEMTASQ